MPIFNGCVFVTLLSFNLILSLFLLTPKALSDNKISAKEIIREGNAVCSFSKTVWVSGRINNDMFISNLDSAKKFKKRGLILLKANLSPSNDRAYKLLTKSKIYRNRARRLDPVCKVLARLNEQFTPINSIVPTTIVSASPTSTLTATATNLSIATPTITQPPHTLIPSFTFTLPPLPTSTNTPTHSPTNTNTLTNTPTATLSPTPTFTSTNTPTPSNTPGSGFSNLASITHSGASVGTAWADYDNDGDYDAYMANINEPNLYFKNNGNGAFVSVESLNGTALNTSSYSAAAGDFDNDGDVDIFVSVLSGLSKLYQNDGNGFFSEVSASYGLNVNVAARTAIWVDIDGDQDLDLHITVNGADLLMRNDGNSFTNIADPSTIGENSNTFTASWLDYDGDGDLDVFVPNQGTDRLFRRNPDGTYTDVIGSTGMSPGSNTRGVAWNDFDNDLDFDIYVTSAGGCNLYRNNGNGTFTDVAAAALASNSASLTFDSSFADYDADGDEDFYVANYNQASKFFQNNNNSTFTDIAPSLGLTNGISPATGLAWVDIDLDGDLDLYINNEGTANKLNVNHTNPSSNTYLKIQQLGLNGAVNQAGSKVFLKSGSTTIKATHLNAGSFGNQHVLPVYFYNLTPSTSYSAQIIWSDGSSSTHLIGTPRSNLIKICKGAGIC